MIVLRLALLVLFHSWVKWELKSFASFPSTYVISQPSWEVVGLIYRWGNWGARNQAGMNFFSQWGFWALCFTSKICHSSGCGPDVWEEGLRAAQLGCQGLLLSLVSSGPCAFLFLCWCSLQVHQGGAAEPPGATGSHQYTHPLQEDHPAEPAAEAGGGARSQGEQCTGGRVACQPSQGARRYGGEVKS